MTRRQPHPPRFEVIQPALKAKPLFWVTSLKRIGVLSGESSSCLGPSPVGEGGTAGLGLAGGGGSLLVQSLQGLAGAKGEGTE